MFLWKHLFVFYSRCRLSSSQALALHFFPCITSWHPCSLAEFPSLLPQVINSFFSWFPFKTLCWAGWSSLIFWHKGTARSCAFKISWRMSSLLDSFALQHSLLRDSANQSSKQAKVYPLKIDCVRPLQGHKFTCGSNYCRVWTLTDTLVFQCWWMSSTSHLNHWLRIHLLPLLNSD